MFGWTPRVNGGSPGNPEALVRVPLGQVVRRVERLDRDPRRGLEARPAARASARAPVPGRAAPTPPCLTTDRHSCWRPGILDSGALVEIEHDAAPGTESYTRQLRDRRLAAVAGRPALAAVGAEAPVVAPDPPAAPAPLDGVARVADSAIASGRSGARGPAAIGRPAERPPGASGADSFRILATCCRARAERDAGPVQHHERRPLAVAQQPEQQVLGPQVVVVEPGGLGARHLDRRPRARPQPDRAVRADRRPAPAAAGAAAPGRRARRQARGGRGPPARAPPAAARAGRARSRPPPGAGRPPRPRPSPGRGGLGV